MWKNNRVTEQLNIEYPIIQAGMAGGITTPELVAAVSNSGGLGSLGAGYQTPEDMRASIKKIRALTDKPFGVNLFVPERPVIDEAKIEASNRLLAPIRRSLHIDAPQISKNAADRFDEQIEAIIECRVPVCAFTFGLPSKETVRRLKSRRVTVIGTATTVGEALLNEELGMDMVVVQGAEAGGHRGSFAASFEQSMVGTMALVPQAADHVHIPVIAAGGIMDGRGVLAALILGAEAVQMGTAFVTSVESGANPSHKSAVLAAAEDGTAITTAFSGKPARGIRNDFITSFAAHESSWPDYPIQNQLTKDIRSAAAEQDRPEYMSMWSGQGTRLSRNWPAGQILKTIVSEIEHFQLKSVVKD